MQDSITAASRLFVRHETHCETRVAVHSLRLKPDQPDIRLYLARSREQD